MARPEIPMEKPTGQDKIDNKTREIQAATPPTPLVQPNSDKNTIIYGPFKNENIQESTPQVPQVSPGNTGFFLGQTAMFKKVDANFLLKAGAATSFLIGIAGWIFLLALPLLTVFTGGTVYIALAVGLVCMGGGIGGAFKILSLIENSGPTSAQDPQQGSATTESPPDQADPATPSLAMSSQ